jgi:hypothetical protein
MKITTYYQFKQIRTKSDDSLALANLLLLLKDKL